MIRGLFERNLGLARGLKRGKEAKFDAPRTTITPAVLFGNQNVNLCSPWPTLRAWVAGYEVLMLAPADPRPAAGLVACSGARLLPQTQKSWCVTACARVVGLMEANVRLDGGIMEMRNVSCLSRTDRSGNQPSTRLSARVAIFNFAVARLRVSIVDE